MRSPPGAVKPVITTSSQRSPPGGVQRMRCASGPAAARSAATASSPPGKSRSTGAPAASRPRTPSAEEACRLSSRTRPRASSDTIPIGTWSSIRASSRGGTAGPPGPGGAGPPPMSGGAAGAPVPGAPKSELTASSIPGRGNASGTAQPPARRKAAARATPSSSASSPGSVTGRRHVKCSHTYAAARPSTGSRPSSSGTSPSSPPRRDDVRAEAGADHALERPRVGADDRDLAHAREREVERLQEVPEGGGVLRGDRVQQPQHAERRLLVAVLAREPGQPQQPEGRRRRPGGDRRVLEVLAPGDQRLVVVGGGEEPAALRVGEALEDRVGERPGLPRTSAARRSPRRASSSASSRKAWSSR